MNQKTEIQLVTEALELSHRRDPYCLPVDPQAVRLRRRLFSRGGPVVGMNTGCSSTLPAKKLTIETHRELALRLLANGCTVVLLGGGPEDAARNALIADGIDVIQSPALAGLRDGLLSVAACDAVVTGDSLGMHLAISQGVWTVAWFGPTCAHEIDFFGRGEAILTSAPCAPCWKRDCGQARMCYDQVDLAAIVAAVQRGLNQCPQITAAV